MEDFSLLIGGKAGFGIERITYFIYKDKPGFIAAPYGIDSNPMSYKKFGFILYHHI